MTAQLWAVVPAGGAGTRLWPLSRAGSPKFLHDLSGSGHSLLQDTHARLAPLVGERLLIVTGVAHQDAVRGQLGGLPADQVIAEPSPRDSMAAIGLAAAIVEARDPEALIGSFAADHVIADGDAFRACVAEAAAVAETGLLVTIGIAPVRPSTGFGYIHLGAAVPGFATAHAVEEFVEKPDAVRAAEYVESGEYRWNAGMFVARATVLLDLLAVEHPDLAAGLRAIAAAPERLEEIWPGLTKIAIDHAVAEPAAAAGRVAVVPATFDWEDIGDFAALSDLVPGEGLKVLGDGGRVLALGSTGLVVPEGGRTVAVLGLEDVVVVDTGDAVLVTTRAHAQDVKSVVEALKASGRGDLT
ncbi:MAG TPA: sugar phosphate nucleotidyltransferase [Marmoricola sp.]